MQEQMFVTFCLFSGSSGAKNTRSGSGGILGRRIRNGMILLQPFSVSYSSSGFAAGPLRGALLPRKLERVVLMESREAARLSSVWRIRSST